MSAARPSEGHEIHRAARHVFKADQYSIYGCMRSEFFRSGARCGWDGGSVSPAVSMRWSELPPRPRRRVVMVSPGCVWVCEVLGPFRPRSARSNTAGRAAPECIIDNEECLECIIWNDCFCPTD